MNRRSGISFWETAVEMLREGFAFLLAAVLLIPLGIIRLVDRLSSWWIHRHGGLD